MARSEAPSFADLTLRDRWTVASTALLGGVAFATIVGVNTIIGNAIESVVPSPVWDAISPQVGLRIVLLCAIVMPTLVADLLGVFGLISRAIGTWLVHSTLRVRALILLSLVIVTDVTQRLPPVVVSPVVFGLLVGAAVGGCSGYQRVRQARSVDAGAIGPTQRSSEK